MDLFFMYKGEKNYNLELAINAKPINNLFFYSDENYIN